MWNLFMFVLVAPYKVFIRTGSRQGAGTDASVYMQIFGDQGDTGIIDVKQVMLSTSGQFAANSECKLEMETVDVGMVRNLLNRAACINISAERSPFTSEVAGSILSENFLNATRTVLHSCEKSQSTLCQKSWVFSGYSVSSHREC